MVMSCVFIVVGGVVNPLVGIIASIISVKIYDDTVEKLGLVDV
jgi:hypothetical protein